MFIAICGNWNLGSLSCFPIPVRPGLSISQNHRLKIIMLVTKMAKAAKISCRPWTAEPWIRSRATSTIEAALAKEIRAIKHSEKSRRSRAPRLCFRGAVTPIPKTKINSKIAITYLGPTTRLLSRVSSRAIAISRAVWAYTISRLLIDSRSAFIDISITPVGIL